MRIEAPGRVAWMCAGLVGALVVVAMRSPGAWAGTPQGPQGGDWASIAKLPNWQGIWQLDWEHNPRLLGMASKPDLTPTARARLTAYHQAQKKGEDLAPESANCLPPGMPQIMTQPYPIEFLFNPGKVVIVIEAYSQVRHIYTDGARHPPDPDATFQGNSIGHWEGDTLVVDTVAFDPDTQIAPGIGHSNEMHIIERIRKTDPDHLQIERTIIDPKVLAKPWTVVLPYVRVNDHIREYICEQNNRDSADAEGRPGERVGP